jgi:hypothetical protein
LSPRILQKFTPKTKNYSLAFLIVSKSTADFSEQKYFSLTKIIAPAFADVFSLGTAIAPVMLKWRVHFEFVFLRHGISPRIVVFIFTKMAKEGGYVLSIPISTFLVFELFDKNWFVYGDAKLSLNFMIFLTHFFRTLISSRSCSVGC